jgi:MFS family permease
LYEGYGFSVASLYCLGFITGALTAPISGPLIDRFGRKKSALLYCALEVGINLLEQFPFLSGLIVSRVVGGITTNLLSTVFEAWLDTEYRSRGFAKSEYETLMRDSVVVSNLAAIASGYLAHILAEAFGPVGPFEGAVTCTGVAFAVIAFLWSENYGKLGGDDQAAKSSLAELKETLTFIRSDSRVLRVCITQGLTLGSLHIFIFLWSPLLKEFAGGTKGDVWGLDGHGNPAYGLIFGAFMAAGVVGGLCSQMCRKLVTLLLSPLTTKASVPETVAVDGEGEIRPMDVEFQGALCYFVCAMLLLAPSLMSASGEYTFSISLFSFIAYEFFVGIYSPCEGVMRSIYIPPESRGSVMTVPSIIVNVAVAIAVVSTETIPRQAALAMISVLMMTCAILQLSLVSSKEWASLFGRIEKAKRASLRPLQSFSSSATDIARSARRVSMELRRSVSAPFRTRDEDDLKVKEE